MAITFITGPMFAGKSTLMYEKITNAKNAIVVCPKIDSRDNDNNYLWTHNGKKLLTCKKVIIPSDNLPDLDVSPYDNIFVSEGQFFGGALRDFLANNSNKNIVCDGLITDYKQRLFGQMFQIAHENSKIDVIELHGKCHKCANPSQYTIRKTNDDVLILIGASQYGTSCAQCLFKN